MKTLTMALGAGLALALLPAPATAQAVTGMAEGAKLYGQNCMRCHSARSPMERTDREWVTVVNHMRARANMRRSEARAVIAFLQATNAPEAGAARGVPAAPEPEVEAPVGPEPPTPPPPVEVGAGNLPVLVLVDLADPQMTPEVRSAVQRYLKRIRNP